MYSHVNHIFDVPTTSVKLLYTLFIKIMNAKANPSQY